MFAVQSNVALLYEILKFSKYLVDITKSRVQNGFVGQVNDSSQMDLAMRMRWAKIMVSMSMLYDSQNIKSGMLTRICCK